MNAEDQSKNPKKKLSVPLLIAAGLAALAVLSVITVAVLWLTGRSKIERQPTSVITIQEAEPSSEAPQEEEAPAASEAVPEPVHDEMLETYTIRRNGKLYRQKQNVKTFLLLGVDRKITDDLTGVEYPSDAHADVLMLVVLDFDTNRMSMLAVPRDTMCEMDTFDKDANPTGSGFGQIALSFRYGDGALKSCALTAKAVSDLLYNIPISGTAALYLDGIHAVNDAVGGVTLTPLISTGSLVAGQETTLTGQQAEEYIREREHTEYGNLQRMEQQKQYFIALLVQAAAKAREKPSSILELYHAVSDYVVTDLTPNEITYLASQVLLMNFNGDISTLPGEIRLSEDNYAEYHLDEKAVADRLTELYFDEVES